MPLFKMFEKTFWNSHELYSSIQIAGLKGVLMCRVANFFSICASHIQALFSEKYGQGRLRKGQHVKI